MKNKADILGIQYSKITSAELLKKIEKLGKNRITITPAPVDSVMVSRKSNYLKKVYLSFDYVLADGSYIVWASKILKDPLPEQIPGPELFPALLNICAKKNRSIYILGSDEKTIEKVKKKLDEKNIQLKGYYCPPFKKKFSAEDNKLMVDKINKANPDFLFLAFGAPKQDIWVYENKNKIKAKIIMSIGAAIDFYAGKVKRAPKWVQKIRLEWFFRLIKEPKRLWKRYARDSLFPLLVLKQAYRKRT